MPPVIAHQTGRRVHRQRRSADDEHIRVADVLQRAAHHVIVQRFLVQHHIGLHDAAAGAPGHPGAVPDEFHPVGRTALHAVVAVDGAVEFPHPLGAAPLVQAVDVLGDHAAQFANRLQFRQFSVGGVGLGIGADHFGPVEPIELLRFPVEKAAAENGLRRIIILLVVQTVHTAEIGNAAFGGHAGAPEKDDGAAVVDPLLQDLDGFFHGTDLPVFPRFFPGSVCLRLL